MSCPKAQCQAGTQVCRRFIRCDCVRPLLHYCQASLPKRQQAQILSEVMLLMYRLVVTLRQEAKADSETFRFLAVQGNLLLLPQQAMERPLGTGAQANSLWEMLVRERQYRA